MRRTFGRLANCSAHAINCSKTARFSSVTPAIEARNASEPSERSPLDATDVFPPSPTSALLVRRPGETRWGKTTCVPLISYILRVIRSIVSS